MFSQVSKAHAAAKAIATPKMVLLYRVAGAIKRDASTPVTKHAVRFTLTGRTRWTLHAPMYKYLPLAKVQAALCGCQTQQKTNIQGKVFTAALAKAATASEQAACLGPARGRLSQSTWPAATQRLPPFLGNG